MYKILQELTNTASIRPADWLRGAQHTMQDELTKIGKKANSVISQDRRGKFLHITTDDLDIVLRYSGDAKAPWDVTWYGNDNGKKMKFAQDTFASAGDVIKSIF